MQMRTCRFTHMQSTHTHVRACVCAHPCVHACTHAQQICSRPLGCCHRSRRVGVVAYNMGAADWVGGAKAERLPTTVCRTEGTISRIAIARHRSHHGPSSVILNSSFVGLLLVGRHQRRDCAKRVHLWHVHCAPPGASPYFAASGSNSRSGDEIQPE